MSDPYSAFIRCIGRRSDLRVGAFPAQQAVVVFMGAPTDPWSIRLHYFQVRDQVNEQCRVRDGYLSQVFIVGADADAQQQSAFLLKSYLQERCSFVKEVQVLAPPFTRAVLQQPTSADVVIPDRWLQTR